jgi:hypothetical protein
VSLERLQEDANGDLVYTFTHPWSDGTTGIRLSPVELLEKLAALVPLPRVHLVRYGGCLAPHSHLRGAIIPTLRQQGVDEEETDTGSPRWGWARLLKRVFALDMARCPCCQQGSLRIIATITQGEVIRKILRHLKLAADPPLIAPARVRQEAFAWSSACPCVMGSGPASDRSNGEGPRSRGLILRLRSPLARPVCAEGGPSRVLPTPPARPAAPRIPHPSPWKRPARPQACTSCSLHDSPAGALCSASTYVRAFEPVS